MLQEPELTQDLHDGLRILADEYRLPRPIQEVVQLYGLDAYLVRPRSDGFLAEEAAG